jgi:hypothetical protein
MAGQLPGFNAGAVRAGLRTAMGVGLPVEVEDRPTFYFPRQAAGAQPAGDAGGTPWEPNARQQLAPARHVQVPCATEYVDNAGKIENFGVMVPSKVVLTLLDEDYVQIKGFAFVVIGGNKFFYQRTQPPLGLVSVGVYLVHCTAEDNT